MTCLRETACELTPVISGFCALHTPGRKWAPAVSPWPKHALQWLEHALLLTLCSGITAWQGADDWKLQTLHRSNISSIFPKQSWVNCSLGVEMVSSQFCLFWSVHPAMLSQCQVMDPSEICCLVQMKNSEWYNLARDEISVQRYVLKANNLCFVQGKSWRNRIYNL